MTQILPLTFPHEWKVWGGGISTKGGDLATRSQRLFGTTVAGRRKMEVSQSRIRTRILPGQRLPSPAILDVKGQGRTEEVAKDGSETEKEDNDMGNPGISPDTRKCE